MLPENLFAAFDAAAPVLQHVLRRLRRWRTPANWSARDWLEDERSVVKLAVWQAVIKYESAPPSSLDHLVYLHALSRALTRHRQECAYSQRCVSLAQDEDNIEPISPSPGLGRSPGQCSNASLSQALECLSSEELYLIRQLFWEERTQADLAHELRISQRAVSKREHRLLDKLRNALTGKIGL